MPNAKYATFWLKDEQMAEIKAHVDQVAEKYGLMSHQEIRADERKRIREALEAEYEKVEQENRDMMGGMEIEYAGVLEGLSFALTAIGIGEEGQ